MALRTTSDLHRFLLETMEMVRDGRKSIDTANAVSKIARHLVDSLHAEAKLIVLSEKIGKTTSELVGNTRLYKEDGDT